MKPNVSKNTQGKLDEQLIALARNTGLSTKAAYIYAAAVELGESNVATLSEKSGIKRTTIYDLLDELQDTGALFQTRREKKTYYIPELPENLLLRARERLEESEEKMVENFNHSPLKSPPKSFIFKKPRIYFLYGPNGFKKIWSMIFDLKPPEFRIITNGVSFLDFVKEKYIIDEIIRKKRSRGIKSKHMIVDSAYARTIVAKDVAENRISKLLPSSCKLSFTEIITSTFVAFISTRMDNTLFIIENDQFAETRKQLFDATWDKLLSPAVPSTSFTR